MASNGDAASEKKSFASSPNDDDTKQNKNSGFECNICFELARNAVLSRCGHLFCWPCIHQWLEIRAPSATCPICKSAISKENLIPIYGRNGTQTDPRDTIPPRPAGTRQESQQNRNTTAGFADGLHFHMSFGIGAFPFGLFQTSFSSSSNSNDSSYQTPPSPTDDRSQQEFLSNALLILAIVVMLFILFG